MYGGIPEKAPTFSAETKAGKRFHQFAYNMKKHQHHAVKRPSNQTRQANRQEADTFRWGGLALVINPMARGGTKYFIYNYRFNGKQQTLRLGKYPDISLTEARERHRQARNDLANGINPSQAKQQAKQARKAALLNTFEHLARQWHVENLHRWKENHAARIMADMEKDVFPHIGKMAIDEIK